eukprot:m.191906 g.191906  ORF g.191906 m.191906 type:complete len:205 (-) comp14850_c1_seq2:914-1528(-)
MQHQYILFSLFSFLVSFLFDLDGTSGVFLKPVEATAMDVIEKGQQAKGHGQETEATKAGSGEGVSHADKTENAGESVSAATQAVPQVPSKTGRKRSKTKLAHRVEFAAVQSSVELNAIYDAVQLKSIGECLMHSNRSRIPNGHLVPVVNIRYYDICRLLHLCACIGVMLHHDPSSVCVCICVRVILHAIAGTDAVQFGCCVLQT